MIARIWKGAVKKDDGDSYATYMRQTGIPGYSGTPGNREDERFLVARELSATHYVVDTHVAPQDVGGGSS